MANLTEDQINTFNLQMRSQPWYSQFFASRGLDPNHTKLTSQQRSELAATATQNGMAIPPHLIIDPAGNVNQHGGFQGQPKWLRALEIGGALAGSMFLPGVQGALGSLFGAGGGTAGGVGSGTALGAGEASTTLGATGGLIPGLSGVGATTATAAPLGAGELWTTLGATGGKIPGLSGEVSSKGGSFMSKLLGTGTQIADAAKVAGAAAEGEAQNRYKKGDQTQSYDRLMLDAQQNRRTNESDALQKLAQAGYIGSGGSHFKPPTIQLNGQSRTAPDFGFGPPPVSDAQRQAVPGLEQEMLKRLQPGGSYTPTKPDYLNRGKIEQGGQIGGLVLGGLGALKNIWDF